MKPFKDPQGIAAALQVWYHRNARDLPFRQTRDPYKIFLSELMLQQTQVTTMLPYYDRFLKRYPTIQSVASAQQSEVLKYWEGLGYYSRARYIHETARMIVDMHGGTFPSDLKTIESLKGIGRYTARAIHSIAFNQPSVAVDGNVMRVISRLTLFDDDIKKTRSMRQVETAVQPLMNASEPRVFTQALMELGALVCTKTPECEVCPLASYCFAYEQNKQDVFPVVAKPREKNHEHYAVHVIHRGPRYYLTQRASTGLLANMWEFPMHTGAPDSQRYLKDIGASPASVDYMGRVNHTFTHKTWTMDVYVIALNMDSAQLVDLTAFSGAISKAHRKIIDLLKANNLPI